AQESRLVALHRPIEIVEFRVPAKACRISLGGLGIRFRADDLRSLAAFGTDRASLLLAGGDHAIVSGLQRRAVGQIGLLDADVDHFDAILPGDAIEAVADIFHDAFALGAEERGKWPLD